jgi:hypothetical protein
MLAQSVFLFVRHPVVALRLVGLGLLVGATEHARKVAPPWTASAKIGARSFSMDESLDWEFCRCGLPAFFDPRRPWRSAVGVYLMGWRLVGSSVRCPRCQDEELALFVREGE